MADLPRPQAVTQILGDMLDDYLSRLDTTGIAPGLSSLKPGSPVLAVLEAVAQAQGRSSQSLIDVLGADDLSRATGVRLERIGAAEKLPKRPATRASDVVTLSDSRYVQKSTTVFAGQPAPIPGSTTLYVSTATGFPATGSVYVGRGTSRSEGPLPYSAVADVGGNYWTITLTTPTTQYHNHNETVILAQGGDRIIEVGQVVATAQGSTATSIEFHTTERAVLLDGEVMVENIPVEAVEAGAVGLIAAGALNTVIAPAFSGLACTNPNPISNGLEVEDDEHYRERIKSIRANRSKATEGTLTTRAYGIKAPDEGSTCTSAKMVVRPNSTSTLYIDDGSGYEPKDTGIDQETLIGSANGGEDTFVLARGKPVAKAALKSSLAEPYALSGASLTVRVGQSVSTHLFLESGFEDINNATAYEVVASINANPSLLFRARTYSNGTKVLVYGNRDTNESVEWIESTGVDAGSVLGFPSGRVDTLRLYLNDRLLTKDGNVAMVSTRGQALWGQIRDGATLGIAVDGTESKTYTLRDSDFVAANTGHQYVNESNSLASWAAVLNYKLTGITAAVVEDRIELTSNLGLSGRAQVAISPSGSVVALGMFDLGALTAQGANSEYRLDRHRGIVELATPLAAGDRLTAGSPYTRAYVESSAITTVAITGDAGHLWFAVDGGAVRLSTGLAAAHSITVTNPHSSSVHRLTATLTSTGAAVYPFTSLREGDWLVVRDGSVLGAFRIGNATEGAFRISNVDPAGQWFEVDAGGATAGGNPATAGTYAAFVFVRSGTRPQMATIAASTTYTAGDLATTIQSSLVGATATVRDNKVRITTNTYDETGDIALVAMNVNGGTIGFSVEESSNDSPHTAAIESRNSETGTGFVGSTVTSIVGPTEFTITANTDLAFTRRGGIPNVRWMRSLPIAKSTDPRTERYGTAVGHTDKITECPSGGTDLSLRSVSDTVSVGDRLVCPNGFHLGPESTLDLTLDQDVLGQSYSIPMFRRLLPDATVPFGAGMKFLDADVVGNPTLLTSFGTSFDFSDFVLYSHARGVTHASVANKAVLWRLKNFRNCEAETVGYQLPALPAQVVSSTWTEPYFDVRIVLSSGARRAATLVVPERIRAVATSTSNTAIVYGYRNLTLSKSGTTVSCTPTLPPNVSSCGYELGQSVYLTSTNPSFPSGFKTLTYVSATEIRWSEGASETIAPVVEATATLTWGATPVDISTSVQVGDVVSVGSTWPTVARRGYEVLAVGFGYVIVPNTTLATAAPNSNFAAVTGPNDVQFYPLDQSTSGDGSTPITTVWLIAQANALATCPVSGVLGGDGSGIQNHGSDYDVLDAVAYLQNGIVHVGSSSHDGVNYTLVAKYAVSGPSIDWANEEFRLVPTTLKNVVDLLNVRAITGLALGGASIAASSNGGKLQLSSDGVGSSKAIQVTGGSANSVSLAVHGSAAVSSPASTLQITVPNSTDLDAVTTSMWVSVDATKPMAKARGWTNVTATIADETLTLDSNVWDYSTGLTQWASPSERTYFERVGKFTAITFPANLAAVPPAGDYITIPYSTGGWDEGPEVGGSAVHGAAYVQMDDGTILAIGGSYVVWGSVQDSDLYSQVRAFDPVTKTWGAFTALPGPLAFASVCKLKDGHIMVCGGMMPSGAGAATFSNKTYIYWVSGADVGTWTTEGDLAVGRLWHTVTALPYSGDVIVTGGLTAGGASESVEYYSAALGTWTLQPNTIGGARYRHEALLFESGSTFDGRLLITGGINNSLAPIKTSRVARNLTTMIWSAAGDLVVERGGHKMLSLPSSKVLVVGGSNRTELYDLVSMTSSETGSMALGRSDACVGTLADGRIVVAGGTNGGSIAYASAEILDLTTMTWTWLGCGRSQHVGSPLFTVDGLVYCLGSRNGATAVNTTDVLNLNAKGPSSANCGTFRIAAASGNVVWVENPNTVDESANIAGALFRKYSSVMPGDVIQIGSTWLGMANQGQWRVTGVDYNNQLTCVVPGLTDNATVALGPDTALLQAMSGELPRIVVKIEHIIPDLNNSNLVHLIVSTGNTPPESSAANLLDRVGEAGGCVVRALDRFDFNPSLVVGGDGYRYHTGLVGEVTRVLYGDSSDLVSYPGYIGAGQTINIESSLVRRIQVSVNVREYPGANTKTRVQNAIAQVVNTAGPNPIPLSDLIAAAAGVDGVISVPLLSPTYGGLQDTIPVQPYETPKILNLDTDIKVNIVGA